MTTKYNSNSLLRDKRVNRYGYASSKYIFALIHILKDTSCHNLTVSTILSFTVNLQRVARSFLVTNNKVTDNCCFCHCCFLSIMIFYVRFRSISIIFWGVFSEKKAERMFIQKLYNHDIPNHIFTLLILTIYCYERRCS